jgi:hypothetical protein
MRSPVSDNCEVSGEFVSVADERFYAIRNVDKMPPFFISLVSDNDHWMFISSNGGLSAGRVSPETALFPYVTVDKIYESTPHTGSKTLLRVERDSQQHHWEPFNTEQDGRYTVTRNLYKNTLGNKLLFEEINDDLQLVFKYLWLTSDTYGFVRHCELVNLGDSACKIELLDGVQNILPAGTPRHTQTNSSYLVDAYKWNEVDTETGLALFSLFSGISDRAEPYESLRATTVFCLGLEDYGVLLSSEQVDAFRHGANVTAETHKRGVRGAYLVNASFTLEAHALQRWQQVANLEQSQSELVQLNHELKDPNAVAAAITQSVAKGTDALSRIIAAADGFQLTNEEVVSAHHYANVLFNTMRGGIFDQQYSIVSENFSRHVQRFNHELYNRHQQLLDDLPQSINCIDLLDTVADNGDLQLVRLTYEYLPITFGRRHGDPSRPWNEFSIKLKDEQGNRLLTYQGNWRDIFQNWETLLFSYPEFIEHVIAKFVNASTADGYNPYRITHEGIDWEVEEPDDPWSYIGYWGDHQIIYLQKLLELSLQFHPDRLGELLHQNVFSYANVPYRIKPFAELLDDAKSTVIYDHEQAQQIEQRVTELGADGKLLLDSNGNVYQVNLLEKLLVPLLSKLGNLVVDGGIWLNTQRPEWNDANNALVGHGLSMVTLYYLRRYLTFFQQLLLDQSDTSTLSVAVSEWLIETAAPLGQLSAKLVDGDSVDDAERYQVLCALGEAASRYRQQIYQQAVFTDKTSLNLELVSGLLRDALVVVDHTIESNRRKDGLFHAYNLLHLQPAAVAIDNLYPMLEGQVAVLSSGAISPKESVQLLETLFASDIFRPDQHTFMLYPDRQLPGFLQKNCVPGDQVLAVPLLSDMLKSGDKRIIEQDAAGTHRFNADLTNAKDLTARLDSLKPLYGETLEASRQALRELYEQVFNHKAFTGRSGGMFGFEGLGSIYWHMVSKLLLAVQETFFSACDQSADQATCQQLASLYYNVRDGIGFNKTPAEYGAFPTDPYSHTPAHLGAQQPGMTGQVKEEILTRFGELGLRVKAGAVSFEPTLLRPVEFTAQAHVFRYVDVNNQWQELAVPESSLAFTWCQVPLIYRLDDSESAALSIHWDNGETHTQTMLTLAKEVACNVFQRNGRIRKIELVLSTSLLLPT